jgi:hypothetical protein
LLRPAVLVAEVAWLVRAAWGRAQAALGPTGLEEPKFMSLTSITCNKWLMS